MDKVRQVGENYELNKYKTLNKTIELDARLANERLLATKLRLNQVSSLNEKLGKQLRQVQQQYRSQEKKLLLTETMLRQIIDGRDKSGASQPQSAASEQQKQQQQQTSKMSNAGAIFAPVSNSGRLSRLRGRPARVGQQQQPQQRYAQQYTRRPRRSASAASLNSLPVDVGRASPSPVRVGARSAMAAPADTVSTTAVDARPPTLATSNTQAVVAAEQLLQLPQQRQQQQQQQRAGKTRTIINDLRQRLNLAVSSKGECVSAAR